MTVHDIPSREDMAREFLNSMLRGQAPVVETAQGRLWKQHAAAHQLVAYAFDLADAVIAQRSPRPTT